MWKSNKGLKFLESSLKSIPYLLIIISFIIIITFLIFFHLEKVTQEDIKNNLFEDQKEKQRQQSKFVANSISQTLKELRADLGALTLSKMLQDEEFTNNSTRDLLQKNFQDIKKIADRIFILNEEDIVVMDIHENNTGSILNQNFSSLDFVMNVKREKKPVLSDGFFGSDGFYRISISYPIIETNTDRYLGLIGITIITKTFFSNYGNIKNIEKPYLFAFDKNANILVTPSEPLHGSDFSGINLYGKVFQTSIKNQEARTAFNNLINISLPVKESVFDLGSGDRFATEYPVLIDGEQIYYIVIVTQLAAIYSEINKLFYSSTLDQFLLLIMALVSVIFLIFFVLKWNRELNKKVDIRTKELRKSYEKLEANDQMQKEFINIAAHELRTPTQSILGYCEMIGMFPKNAREYLEPVKRNSEQLYRLTEDILDLTRIESGTLRLEKSMFDVKEIIENVLNDITIREKNNDLSLNNNIAFHQRYLGTQSEGSILIYADKNRIQQVLFNLLTNAIKFTKNGTITIIVEKEKHFMSISIKDTGKGINPDVIPKIFEKFFTKSNKGTGLGLYISKNIIEAHGGKVWGYNNIEGKGAIFGFLIPV